MLPLLISLISIFQSTLPNGLRIVLEEDHSSPITTVNIFVDIGSVYEGINTGKGLSHFCEHVVSGGTTLFRTESEYNEMENRWGSHSNAYTSWEVTCYHQTVPSKYSDSTTMALLEQVFSCEFDSFEIAREHGVIHHEILTSDTPDERIWDAAFLFFFGSHPLSVPILGLEDAMLAISEEDLKNFYETHYCPSNAVLVAVGDFNTTELYEFILKESEKFPSKPYEPSFAPPTTQYTYPRCDTFYDEIPHPLVYMIWNGAQKNTLDYTVLSVMSQYLTGGQASYLKNILVEDRELAFEVWSYNMGLRRADGAFMISSACQDPLKLDESVKIIQSEIDKIARGEIDEARFLRTKNLIRYGLLEEWSAGTKSQLMGDGMLTANDPLYFQNSMDQLSIITTKDLSEAASRMLSSSRRQTFFAFPSEYEDEISPNERFVGRIPFILFHTQNYPAVLSQKNPGSLYVSMQIAFGGGKSIDPAGLEGATRIISEVLALRTTLMNYDKINEKMDELGISRSAQCSDNHFYINFDFPLENFDEAMKLIGEALSKPDFSDEAVKDAKNELIFELAQNATNPNYLHGKFFRTRFYSPNSHNRYPDESSISNISREDLENLYRKMSVENNVVVSMTGDVESDRVLFLIKKHFPRLGSGSSLVLREEPDIFTPSDDSLFYGFQQTLVTYAFQTIPWNHPDKAAMLLLDEVMSGVNSRIHDALRGRQDLVYWGWGYQESFSDMGSFIFIAQTSLKNEDKVKQAYLDEIDRIKNELLTPEELDCLKNSIFSSWDMSEQNPGSRLSRYSFLYLMGENPDYYETVLRPQIESLSAEDVREAAVKYYTKGYWFISRPEQSDF